MLESVELCQLVARAVNHITWNIPMIRDGKRWRNIENSHLVENPTHVNGYDHFENAIFRAKQIMEAHGGIPRLPIPRKNVTSTCIITITG
jgi:hypothetical protein